MNKDEVIRKYKEYLFPSVGTYFTEPLVTDHASMQYLWDADGKQYLDFFGGIVTISVGHANPRVTDKIVAQTKKLQHASTMLPNEARTPAPKPTRQRCSSRACTPDVTRSLPCDMPTQGARNWHSRSLGRTPGVNRCLRPPVSCTP